VNIRGVLHKIQIFQSYFVKNIMLLLSIRAKAFILKGEWPLGGNEEVREYSDGNEDG
jgi:hypothetical protein